MIFRFFATSLCYVHLVEQKHLFTCITAYLKLYVSEEHNFIDQMRFSWVPTIVYKTRTIRLKNQQIFIYILWSKMDFSYYHLLNQVFMTDECYIC